MNSAVDPDRTSTWPWLDVIGTLAMQPRWWRRLTESRNAAEQSTAAPATAGADALAQALHSLSVMPEVPCDGLGAVDLIELRTNAILEMLGGRRRSSPVDPAAAPVIHDLADRLVALMHAAGRAATVACPPPDGTGALYRVSRGGGGAPKAPVEAAAVTAGGLAGDAQADRVNHGRPWQALSLWSAEVIEALRAEGHPVSPGSCGENLTLTGIDWTALHPGVQVRIGDDLVAEISGEADPCRTIAASFTGRRFDRIDHAKHPGWSRVYAWVVQPGEARTGAPVTLG